jgi:predicted membrane channel-forming protein YqfA (hemolysin III family)
MFAISMPGGLEWLMILFFIGYMWLVIATVVSIAKNPQLEMTHKLLWLLIVVIAPLLGVIVYYVFQKNVTTKT